MNHKYYQSRYTPVQFVSMSFVNNVFKIKNNFININ
jgi:hypothetical protein